MPIPQIPIYTGDVPQRTQAPEVFSVNADAWLAYQAPLAANYNQLADYLNQYNYADRGFFTPTAQQEYPDTSGVDVNQYFGVAFPSTTDDYTFTSGDLSGVTVTNGATMRYSDGSWTYALPYGGGVSQAQFNQAQMLPYSPTRTYKQNETCTTFNATTGELEVWTSYAPSDNVGHNPQDTANRHDDWTNFPTPCWWIKSHAVEPGTPVCWFSDDIPENALQVMDTDIDAGFYHRIAKAYPSLVADGKINLADILGRYIRIADGGDYVVNTTHEDAMRKITGTFSVYDSSSNANAASSFSGSATTVGVVSGNTDGYRVSVSFDTSRVVPTAPQNQPQSVMANLIIFL